MRAIMAAALISVILALFLTLAVHRPAEDMPDSAPTETVKETPAASPTPEEIIPIEIIDGEIWVALTIEGMPEGGK